jgi:hypothetical protein
MAALSTLSYQWTGLHPLSSSTNTTIKNNSRHALLKQQRREQPDKNKGFGFITFEDMAMAVAAKDGAR